MTLLDEEVRRLWHYNAARGSPPPIEEYAAIGLGLQTPWHWQEHFFPIVRAIRKTGARKRFLRQTARDHAKSWLTYVLVLYVAEFILPYLGINRINQRIYMFGRDEPHVVNEIMENLHDFISEHTPWLKLNNWEEAYEAEGSAGIKNAKPKNFSKTRFDLTNGVSIRGRSIRQGVRGAHIYLAVVDDLVDENNYMFAQQHEDIVRFALLPAIKQGGVILILGTPQPGDIYERLEADPQWDSVRLPAEANEYREKNEYAIERGWLPAGSITCDDDWRCLWPWQHNHESLMEIRGSTLESILAYEREMLLKRNDASDAFVPRDLVNASLDHDLCYIPAALPGEGPYYGGADPSKLSRDDSAVCIGILDKDGLTRIPRHWNIQRALGDKAPEDPELLVIGAINSASLAFHNPLICLESNGFQSVIRPFLSKLNPTVAIRHFNLNVNKHTEAGWLAVRNLFRNHQVRLPYGPTPAEARLIESGHLDPTATEARRLTDEFIRQLMNLRIVDGRIVNADSRIHDDLVSAFFLFAKASESGVATQAISTVGTVGPRRDKHVPRDDPELGPRARSPTQQMLDRVSRANRLASTRRRPF